MHLQILHTTHYTYPTPTQNSHNELRLMPLSDSDQTCLDFRLLVSPDTPLFAYDLPTGRVHHFNLRPPHQELHIIAESLVSTHQANPFCHLQLLGDDTAFYCLPHIREHYWEYLAPTERVPLTGLIGQETDRIAAVARRHAGSSTASFLISLTHSLYRAFSYTPGATEVDSPLTVLLEHGHGVCQDFAHLMLAICRRQGIPARYISGYLYTGDKGGEAGEGTPPLVSGDAMHAWVECLLPNETWRGFDPTNNLVTNDTYIKVHSGRDYSDVTPVRGIYQGPRSHGLEVAVRVTSAPILPDAP